MGENHEKWSRVMRAALAGYEDQIGKYNKLEVKPPAVTALKEEVESLWDGVKEAYNSVLPDHADDFMSSAPSETKTAGKLAELATEASRTGARLANIEEMLKYILTDGRDDDEMFEDGALCQISFNVLYNISSLRSFRS
jgi:hypothetical protein